jgi:hypothetical protein
LDAAVLSNSQVRTASNHVVTFGDFDQTVATVATAQTLFNKTLASPVISEIVNGAATVSLPNVTDTLVGRLTMDTLANKTLTSPQISEIVNGGATLTVPSVTDTLVGRATSDTLTNKTIVGATVASIVNGGQTISFPVATDTVVCRDTIDTLTNKTLTSPTIATIVNGAATVQVPLHNGTLATIDGSENLTNKTLTSPHVSSIMNGLATVSMPIVTSTLATLAGTETLTNKTLTTPKIVSILCSDFLLTLPAATDTLVGRATTDTLTNKTITSCTVGGVTTASGTVTNGAAMTIDFTNSFITIGAAATPSYALWTSGKSVRFESAFDSDRIFELANITTTMFCTENPTPGDLDGMLAMKHADSTYSVGQVSGYGWGLVDTVPVTDGILRMVYGARPVVDDPAHNTNWFAPSTIVPIMSVVKDKFGFGVEPPTERVDVLGNIKLSGSVKHMTNTYTFPVTGGEFVTLDATQTLTGKTLTGAAMTSPTISGLTLVSGTLSSAGKFYLNADTGKMSIGTTASVPTQALEVDGNIVVTGTFMKSTSIYGLPAIGATTDTIVTNASSSVLTNKTITSAILAGTSSAVGKVYVDATNGRIAVGSGATAPTESLEVTGNQKITGAFNDTTNTWTLQRTAFAAQTLYVMPDPLSVGSVMMGINTNSNVVCTLANTSYANPSRDNITGTAYTTSGLNAFSMNTAGYYRIMVRTTFTVNNNCVITQRLSIGGTDETVYTPVSVQRATAIIMQLGYEYPFADVAAGQVILPVWQSDTANRTITITRQLVSCVLIGGKRP